ncbi:hypothetical protein BOX15_Mlig002220g3 [Macrostomum lignano]|uniref:Uncharacterized protein n=1 Tax=Macrostomum lignano TaxID=282301 RepID=A0A267H3G0_9PLAT|nr:hypothetical protein BOX15_Mlig002220g3 [Macrostomum lignano]
MSYQLSKSAGMATSSSDFHLPSIRQGGGSQRPSSAASTSSSVSNVHDFRQAVASSQQKPFRSRRAGRAGIAAGRPAAEEAAAASRREARSSSRESARSVHSHFADFLGVAYGGRDPDGFLPKSKDEDCIKCMLKVPHDKCESHRYIRVGGGYRHSFWYIKVLLEEIELARHQALIRQKRLETIAEGNIRAVKTYIRTKSGRMVEKVIFMSEDDYQNFQQFVQQGGDPSSLVRKYLSKEDAQNLQGFDKEEQKAIKTVVRTKSGRVIEKIVYVSRDEYDKIQRGEVDANAVLRRRLNLKDGEQLEKWSAPKMRTITTRIRTKSGRIIEKKVLVSDEDYQKLKEGKADLSKVLGKYLSKDDGEVEGWSAPQKEAMKVIKTYVRTKSGKLVEKTILMTEDEFKEFEKSGGDPNILKRFMKLKDGEKIDKWEKASTVYADSDDDGGGPPKKPGERTVDKHGNVFEYVKDPLTGKVYKKQINKDAKEKGAFKTKGGKIITAADVKRRQDLKQGKRNVDSESEYSYKSEVSDGGTRHVYRRVKKADGTYGDRESYHSSEDEEGQARRRRRRRERKHGNDSAKSFFSDVSEGGTRRVFVRERKPDGTYGEAKEYHSDDSDDFQQAAKAIKQQQKKAKERQHGSDSEHSYVSEYSENGTRTRKRRQRIRDEFGNVIGYGKEVEYESPQASDSDEGGGGGGGQGRKGGGKKGKQAGKGQKGPDGQDVVGGSDSEHSYVSEVSEHGTRHIMRRERIRDADGNVIGYGKKEEYTGKRPVLGHGADGKKSRKKRDETGVEYEVYSDTSEGGTKRTMRRKVIRDELGNVIGHGEEEVYDSDDADTYVTVSDGKGGKIRKLNMAKAANRERVRRAEQKAAEAAAAGGDKKKRKGKTVRLANGVEVHVSSDSEVFSDASTDSEVVREQLANMTEEERQEFLRDRAARQQARENRRKEKYGAEYSKMTEKNARKKEERKRRLEELQEEATSALAGGGGGAQGKEKSSPKKSPAKSMVVYDNKSNRFKDLPPDDRGIGLGHNDWGQPEKGRRKLKDGNEADSESDYEPGTERRKRDKKRPGSTGSSDSDSGAEIIRGKDGKILKKVKKDKDGNVVELEYDDKGNVVKRTVRQADEDQGDYFEKGSDGKIRLKKGKKRLDLDKISRDELRALGIDPNASKAEIMRQLKQKLGGDVDVHFKGKKIGAKAIDEYSDIDSDKLAEDDDLDVETLTGIKRLRVIMKKGGSKLISHMHELIEKSHLADNATEEEKATEIDFLSAYRLVDPNKLETYGKAFVVEDFDDMDGLINVRCAKRAISMVPSVAGLSERQIDYALQVLGFDGNTQLTFRMFSVAMALCERVTKMDQFCRDLLEITNLIDIERKLALYRAMFYCNIPSDRDPNYIKLDSLRIELMAGGLNWRQQEFIIDKLQPNEMFEISFLDYLCYIPLFLSFHDNILSNPLDMSDLKYTPTYRRRASAQRDMNPLAFPLKKNTKFMRDHAVGTLMEGKPLDSVVRKDNEKVQKAFDRKEGSISYPASAKGQSKDKD